MTGKSAEMSPQNSRPTGVVGEKFELLMELLRELFQLDKGDLDFGLYRVMNMKAAEIEAFLKGDLLPQARKNLARLVAGNIESLETELEEKIVAYKLDGMTVEQIENVKWIIERRAVLKSAREGAATEGHIYNHLYQFFSRYYDSGDFMSLRRMRANGDTSYLIPYNGEEVKLHWANADQYYIKTTENFSSYIFGHENWPKNAKVRFEIASADSEKDNIKAENGRDRRFVLTTREGQAQLAADGDQLVIYFDHRPLTDTEAAALPGKNNVQAWLNDETQTSVLQLATKLDPAWAKKLAQSAPTENDPDRTILAKHLAVYTAKNSFDYFIHKDLRGFLRRELDLYLKTEIMVLDDFDPDNVDEQSRLSRVLVLMSAVRSLGGKIIDFLAQLEDFHKSIWLKKKFVLETNYGITLDKVPKSFYAEIAVNEAQVAEWVELYALDEIADTTKPLPVSFLNDSPNMVVDTKHFNKDFTDRLLTTLADGDATSLEEGMDGLLVHSENFQALNLLQTRYEDNVQCIYIDPPYNTGDSEILYKNGYLRSSWLSMIDNNLLLARKILSKNSVFFIAIDDFEMVDLAKLLDSQYHWLKKEIIVVNHHPQGGKATALSQTHEYMISCFPISSEKSLVGRKDTNDVEHRPFKRSGSAESNFRHKRKNSFYAILVSPNSGEVVALEPPPSNEYPTGYTKNGLLRVYPIGAKGEERVWRRSYESCLELLKKKSIYCSKNGTIYQKISASDRKAALFSNWIGARYNSGVHGAGLLGHIIGEHNPFPYPKSIHTMEDAILSTKTGYNEYILDYFAGSGTTAHAVMNLNREDGGSRKYIMVEMGRHFETVLLPRIKKVAYSHNWKDGKPVSREGQSHFFKYIKLESHEDALDSLQIKPPEDAGELFADNPELAEDYALRYQLTNETSSSASLCGGDFARPGGYTLSVVRDGARRDVAVDLPETFNYLIGLRVYARRVVQDVLAISGIDSDDTRCLILWRDVGITDNDALNEWFKAHGESIRKEFNASLIYINGDHELGRLAPLDGSWMTSALELVFREKMFETGAE